MQKFCHYAIRFKNRAHWIEQNAQILVILSLNCQVWCNFNTFQIIYGGGGARRYLMGNTPAPIVHCYILTKQLKSHISNITLLLREYSVASSQAVHDLAFAADFEFVGHWSHLKSKQHTRHLWNTINEWTKHIIFDMIKQHKSSVRQHQIYISSVVWSRNLKWETKISFWPLCNAIGVVAMLTVMYGRWAIVPSNLAQSFCGIWAYYHFCMFYRTIT